MWRSRIPVAVAFAIFSAMVWLDWNFPTEMYYSPLQAPREPVATWLLLKKHIELSLSALLLLDAAAVLLWKRSGKIERMLVSAACGAGVAFWMRRDLLYLLMH